MKDHVQISCNLQSMFRKNSKIFRHERSLFFNKLLNEYFFSRFQSKSHEIWTVCIENIVTLLKYKGH